MKLKQSECNYIFIEQNFNSAVMDVYLTKKGGLRVFSLFVLVNEWMDVFEHYRL